MLHKNRSRCCALRAFEADSLDGVLATITDEIGLEGQGSIRSVDDCLHRIVGHRNDSCA